MNECLFGRKEVVGSLEEGEVLVVGTDVEEGVQHLWCAARHTAVQEPGVRG